MRILRVLVMLGKLKETKDKGNNTGALLTSFLGFDCISHKPQTVKLYCYRISSEAVKTIFFYLKKLNAMDQN